jgi:hypothetical protein
MIIKNIKYLSLLSYFVAGVCAIASAQKSSLFDVFQEQEMIDVVLTSDFQAIKSNKSNETYQTATFEYKDSKGQKKVYQIELRQRGKYRRRICEMPPIKLSFNKEELQAEGLRKSNDMKLVTYCIDDISSKETIVKEYLTYKLYNELTPYSLRVQLARITYVDTASKTKVKHFGFLIEDIDEMAKRLNSKEIEELSLDTSKVNIAQEALASTFNYMIANGDWSVTLARNVKFIQPNDSAKILVIPYDFDFAGLVDAPYAIPNPDLGLTSIKQRAFLGINEDELQLRAAKQYIATKKDALYSIIKTCKHLTKETKQQMIDYLETFFNPSPNSEPLLPAFK